MSISSHGHNLDDSFSLGCILKLDGFLYRLARKVLDKEDVAESFLKKLPAKTDHYEIIFPVCGLLPCTT